MLFSSTQYLTSQDQATADKYAATCFQAAAIYGVMIVLSGDLASPYSIVLQFLVKKAAVRLVCFDTCLMLFKAGCWLNGSKLQENEAKKKVATCCFCSLLRVLDLISILQQMRMLGGRAVQ
jgi:hypothetical protein